MRKTLKSTLADRRKNLLRKTQHKKKPRKRVLTLKKRKHTDNPVYMSGTYTEYFIKMYDQGFFTIHAYRTQIPAALKGKWTNFRAAEAVLIKWLIKTDKLQQSRYPGCPERRETNYTRTFLKG